MSPRRAPGQGGHAPSPRPASARPRADANGRRRAAPGQGLFPGSSCAPTTSRVPGHLLEGQQGEPLAKQVKRGLGDAFRKFDEYQLAKYNGTRPAVPLRDVLFHFARQADGRAQAELWKQLAGRATAGYVGGRFRREDKKETFERLIREKKLGYFALIRNLRNMVEVRVDPTLVREAILARKNGAEKVLPFRFVAAARLRRSSSRSLMRRYRPASKSCRYWAVTPSFWWMCRDRWTISYRLSRT